MQKEIKISIDAACEETYKKVRSPTLWNTLLNDFTADKVKRGLWKEIHPANAFIGYYLRLDLLSKENEKDAVLKDIEDFFYILWICFINDFFFY